MSHDDTRSAYGAESSREDSNRAADNCSLFIGNLPFKMSDEGLRELLTPYGEVTRVRVVLDRETQRSRGFAFAAMKTPEEAAAAIAALDGYACEGRDLRVNLAESSKDRPSSPGGNGRRSSPGGGGYRGDRNSRSDGGGGGKSRGGYGGGGYGRH